MAPDRGAEGEAKWQTFANWNANRAREKAILDRLIKEEIPEVAETAESFGLTEEQAERWQPIVRQRVEAYVKQKANALKGADTEVFYDAGIDAVARAIAAYKGDPKGLDAYIGRAVSNAFNTTATKLRKSQTASLDESIGEDGARPEATPFNRRNCRRKTPRL